jgi:hypothetical protein
MQTLYEATAASKTQPVTERIKTFEDACRELGITKIELGITGMDEDVASINAYAKLIIIAKALNEGWKPDWADSSQYKYIPWFEEKSGFGLSYVGYGIWDANTSVGSRLCYKNREIAIYAANHFKDLYNDYLTIKTNK